MTLHAAPDLQRHLTEAATRRQRQLDELPPSEGDLVAQAHRESIERILDEITSAHRRLADGTYGDCLRCHDRIPLERLEVRPWTAYCVRCAGR